MDLGVNRAVIFFLTKSLTWDTNLFIKKLFRGGLIPPIHKPEGLLAVVPWAFVFLEFRAFFSFQKPTSATLFYTYHNILCCQGKFWKVAKVPPG